MVSYWSDLRRRSSFAVGTEQKPNKNFLARVSPRMSKLRSFDPSRLPMAGAVRGRGATDNPANRFDRIHVDLDPEALDSEPRPETIFLRDATRSAFSKNDSPDLGFDYSFNPYRGCEHGCSYCYARPTHEYLGFSAGLDFETRILVKDRVAERVAEALRAPRWKPQTVALSGVTDAYQPVERKLRVTRSALEVFRDFRNPIGIVTKNHLVTRDIDLLADLAQHKAAAVILSVTSLDRHLQRELEPRASTPERRLEAIRALADAGIPVGVNVAPVIPGLTDSEIPTIVAAAAEAGASFAGMIVLRLPLGVKQIFETWLRDRFPDRADRVLNRVRELRAGKLNDSRFGTRGRGEGPLAEQLQQLFRVARRRNGLEGPSPVLSASAFRVPSHWRKRADPSQGELF
jgi:DNA repair photolyase